MGTRRWRGGAAALALVLSTVTASWAEPAKEAAPPFRGKVTGSNVNIRMAPGRDGLIVRVAREGESVLVTGREGGWFRIVPPENAWCWIPAASIKKTEGDTTVSRDTVLRQDARNNATEVGRIEKGTAVKVLAEKSDWYKIQAPRWVPMYIHDEYVVFDKAYDPQADGPIETIPGAEPKAGEPTGGATKAGEPTGGTKGPVKVEPTAEEKAAKREAEIQELKRKYEEIQRQYDRDVKQALESNKPPKKIYDASGVVDTVGLFLGRPGTHALVSGKQIVCYLKVADPEKLNLNRYYGQMVGVRGKAELARGFEPTQVITVEVIETLVKD
jgi:uncharacterized protein YgiM (DUF1202 family)